MNNGLTIIRAKGHISVQDMGRFTAQHLGFSASGVADEYAFLSANKHLQNKANTPVLEVMLGQITFTVNCTCQIMLTGANCQPHVNEKPVLHWQVLSLNANDIIELKAPKSGVYTYIAVAGGIDVPTYLNSSSALPIALQADFKDNKTEAKHAIKSRQKYFTLKDVSPIKTVLTRDERNQAQRFYFSNSLISTSNTLRFIPHQLWYKQPQSVQKAFTQQTFVLSSNSNKMGYRLTNDTPIDLVHNNKLSKPVALGAIQIPSDGQPIVLMKDRQTMGGYPTIGNVIQVDIPRLAQLTANQKVQFKPIKIEQAQVQWLAFNQKLNYSGN